MRVSTATLVRPERNGPLIVAAVAASTLVFAYSTLAGPVAILVYYALWFPLAALAPRRVFGGIVRNWPMVAFAGVAALSVLWSDAPSATLRAAVQLATHLLCAIVAVRLGSPRAIGWGLVLGTAGVLALSALFGRYSYDVLDGSYAFVGLFGSKNQLGFFASVGALIALALLPRERGAMGRGALALAAAGSLAALAASSSATAAIALIAAAGAWAGAVLLARLSPTARAGALLVGLVLAGAALAAIAEGTVVGAVLAAFGKDDTLTGRTYLWSEGMAVFAERPLAGVGYAAFWVQGFAHAERLWAEFFIASRTGFHFHNTWIASLVEVGVVGTAALAIAFLRPLAGGVRTLFEGGAGARAALSLALMAMLAVRSLSEVDATAPFTLGVFLLVWAGSLARRRSRATAARPGAVRPAPPPFLPEFAR